MDFGEKLKEIRRNEGMSQEQLAEKIGVSRQAITKWETGRGLPDVENMVILAEIFKMTLDELVSQEKSRSRNKVQFMKAKLFMILIVTSTLIFIWAMPERYKFFLAQMKSCTSD